VVCPLNRDQELSHDASDSRVAGPGALLVPARFRHQDMVANTLQLPSNVDVLMSYCVDNRSRLVVVSSRFPAQLG